MKAKTAYAVMAVVATALVGCSSGGSGDSALDTASPTANVAPSSAPVAKHSRAKPADMGAPPAAAPAGK